MQGRELEMSIVPKVEEEDPQLLLPVEAALSVAAIKAAASQIPTQEQGVDSDIPEVEGSISNDTRASAINKDRNAFAVSDGSRTLSSGMLLGSLESKDDTIASAGLRGELMLG